MFEPAMAHRNSQVTMIGGKGSDVFLLGDLLGDFMVQNGRSDHALIKDFERGDRMVLSHRAEDYVVDPIRNRKGRQLPKKGFEVRARATNDLIAIVRGKGIAALWRSSPSGESLLSQSNGPFQFLGLDPVVVVDPLA